MCHREAHKRLPAVSRNNPRMSVPYGPARSLRRANDMTPSSRRDLLILSLVALISACNGEVNNEPRGSNSTGGTSLVGGVISTGGTSLVGGVTSTGGTSLVGGVTSTGGTSPVGDATSTGGTSSAGGANSSGGFTSTSTDRNAQLTASCLASGGVVMSAQCCAEDLDFHAACNTTGPCSCGPFNSVPKLVCRCATGCFDGTKCVSH